MNLDARANPPILTGGSTPRGGSEIDFVVAYSQADHIIFTAKSPQSAYLARRGRWTLYDGKAISFATEAEAVAAAMDKGRRLPEQTRCFVEVHRREFRPRGQGAEISLVANAFGDG